MAKLDRNEIMEALSALENFIHAEYHYVEALSVNNELIKDHSSLLDLMRAMHATRTEMMDDLVKTLPNIGPLWCTLKHMLLTRMSLLEAAEKCADKDDATKFLAWADSTYHMIKDMVFELDFSGFKSCSRCDDDKEKL